MSHKIKEFQVLKVRAFTILVCTSMTEEEAVSRTNESRPAGDFSAWKRVEDRVPVPCPEAPESHNHITFEC